jgi:hypothetical protein
MGLKYTFFIVEADPDELLKNLVAGGAVDKTALMLAEHKWSANQMDEFRSIHTRQAPTEEKSKMLMDALERERPPELEAYHKETDGPEFHGMEFWWMRFPSNPKYIIGGFTSYMFQRELFMAVAAHYLVDMGKLRDIWFISYHHGSNDGNICKILHSPAVELKNDWVLGFPHQPEETERYEEYAARIDREAGAPAVAVHNWILDEHGAVPWTHNVRFPIANTKRKH